MYVSFQMNDGTVLLLLLLACDKITSWAAHGKRYLSDSRRSYNSSS